VATPIVGIGTSRDPAEQEPLVLREAQAVLDLLGVTMTVPKEAVVTIGGWWQPKYSVPNAPMVEAVQMLARSEGLLLDPVYTGKAMAGLIGLARKGFFAAGEKVLFLHTGGLPSLFAYGTWCWGTSRWRDSRRCSRGREAAAQNTCAPFEEEAIGGAWPLYVARATASVSWSARWRAATVRSSAEVVPVRGRLPIRCRHAARLSGLRPMFWAPGA
jgi:hypothetical protein